VTDRTLALIRQLRPEGQAAAIYLINEARDRGLPAIVVEARRGIERQRTLLREGRTKTLRSKHLVGRAMDIGFASVPTADAPLQWWSWLHDLWDDLGGGARISWDLNHFEW